jgi:TDG/mug DNA glycosylase family protein
VDLTELELPAVPIALADLHRDVPVGTRLELTLAPGDDLHVARARAVVEAGGLAVERFSSDGARIAVTATALRALPDHVGAGMRLLCCGLNPSLHAADAGVGYITGSNRFWKAMALAGLATRDRDPRHLLLHDRVGMTDLVKRATARADELSTAEYRAGVERLELLCGWLRPGAVAVVGLAGWRAAVDRKATVGWQAGRLGASPVYVLPSTSGLNAGTSLDDLVAHLLAAAAGPPGHARAS